MAQTAPSWRNRLMSAGGPLECVEAGSSRSHRDHLQIGACAKVGFRDFRTDYC